VNVGWLAADNAGSDSGKTTYGYNAFYIGGGQYTDYGSGCHNATVVDHMTNGVGAAESALLAPTSTVLLIDNSFRSRTRSEAFAVVGAPTIPDVDDDSRLNCTAAGAGEDADSFPNLHFNGMNVAFVDGHVKWLTKAAILYRPSNYTASCGSAFQTSTDANYIWNRY
jgi:prepilin-type processing-associated H-X9-DG protein